MKARLGSLLLLMGLGLVVAARLVRTPMDAYGDSAAQYIEHLARLRLVERIGQGVGPDPLSALVQLDSLYPPGLHLLTFSLSPLLGHRAEAVVWTGLLWWALLAAAVGLCARSLRPGAGPWAMAATAAVPALHASATRYYYDLPMTALVWCAIALLLTAGGRRRPGLRGAAAGALFAGACLVKWSALPLGLPLLLGATASLAARVDLRTALRAGVGTLLGGGILLGSFVLGGSTSFGAMSGATFQPPVGVDPDRLQALSAMPGGSAIRAMLLQAAAIDMHRLAFYPTRLISTVLSPVLALAAAPLGWSWWRARAPGWPLLLLGVGGTGAFLLFLVPPLDDRFLLTVVPVIALAAGLGASALPRAGATAAALLGGILSLAVAADLHLRPPAIPLHVAAGQLRDDGPDGRRVEWRLGAGSSWDLRGWARSDAARRDRTRLRTLLDAQLSRCGRATLDAHAPGTLTAFGEDNWFAYREALARLENRAVGPAWPSGTPTGPAGVLLQSDPPDAFGEANRDAHTHLWRVSAPDGGPGLLLSSETAGLCPGR